jgi:exoribonuclease R
VFRIDLTPDNELNNAVGVVNEMDLVVGEIAASFCTKMNVPMIYKSQAPIPLDLDFKATRDPMEDRIKQESLDKLYKKDRSDESVISQITRRNNFPPEVYSITPKKHNGLALYSFGQIANPLNDYYDLANHFQLKHAAILSEWQRNKDKGDEDCPVPETPFNHNVLHDIVSLSESRKADIMILQKNSTRFWIYWSIKNDIEDNIYTQYSGLVVIARDDRNETTVLIRHYELEAKMTTKRKYTKGERIFLKVEHVDPFYDRLVLKEAKGKSSG